MENVNFDMVKQAVDSGVPAMKELASKVPKEQAAAVIGIMVILGVAYKTIDSIKEIILKKF